MRIGIAADHAGYTLKTTIKELLIREGYAVTDFGASELDPDDDFPDMVIPMAKAVAKDAVDRGIALCGSGVGACIAANKVAGVRAGLVMDSFSARQGVEDDNMNVVCIGARVLGRELAWELILIFLQATFSRKKRFIRRLAKVKALER